MPSSSSRSKIAGISWAFFLLIVNRRPTLIPTFRQLRIPCNAASKAPGTPLNLSFVSLIPSSETPTYDRPISFRTFAIFSSIRVPLVEITARIPLSLAYMASSGKSFRIVGSPPENNITGEPNWARSSMRSLPCWVVSSSSYSIFLDWA